MKTRFFCVAVEGATTDGRVIERAWIEEMAADYNPQTYGARVNMEHIRGFSPDKPFNAYGDVIAVEKREIELSIGGKTEKKLALFAQLDANDQLVANVKAGQKVYTSIEVNPNFAGKGRAYLMGLAVTDSPASLGTEMLSFAASAKVNPLAERKQHADNLFTATGDPVAIELEDDKTQPGGRLELSGLQALIDRFTRGAPAPEKKVEAVELSADNKAVGEALTAVADSLRTFSETYASDRRADRAAFGQLQADFTALKADIEKTPSRNHAARPPAAGGDGKVLADC